jgi:cold shock CspA family protein
MCYEAAYRKALQTDRAVVAHFYAGHLARNMKDVSLAIQYEREAHALLRSDETAMALGNYLVWNRKFEEGVRLIEPASKSLDGKARLIAISSLARAYQRWADYSFEEEHNALHQYRRGLQGFSIATAALEAGIFDAKLVGIAADCATAALHGATAVAAAGMPISSTIPDLATWVDGLTTMLVRFVGARSWPWLVKAIEKLKLSGAIPAAAQRLHQQMVELEKGVGSDSDSPGSQLYGEVVTLKDSYGFIRHPSYPENIFFHTSDVNGTGGVNSLNTGALVSFSVEVMDRGPRARRVSRRIL